LLLKRLYHDGLAQASYLLGCQATGEALVVDPNRNSDQYIAAAAEHGLRVTHVTETHIHADFLSGSRELATHTGAELLLSAEGGPDWQYVFASDTNARMLREGDSFMVGRLHIDVMHTPGHTPEHLTFVVIDSPASARPVGAFTGDFIFVGDVGRPDLLERAANVGGSMREGARALHRSLQRMRALPDYLQLWPGHGAGSACGKSLGAMPQSVLGYEKTVNWAFQLEDESSFIEGVLEGQPEPPTYFATMKRLNRDGPAVLGAPPSPTHLPPADLTRLLAGRAVIVDIRAADAFAARFIPGTINIPLNRSFLSRAGWVLGYDTDIVLLTDSEDAQVVRKAAAELSLIGLDRLVGWFGGETLSDWTWRGNKLQSIPQLTIDEVDALRGRSDITLLDVRNADEWDAAHIEGAVHVPLGHLAARLRELPLAERVVVYCQSGSRSGVATSILAAHGVRGAHNMRGGITAWQRDGRPVVTDQPAPVRS
jgi:hydroxyacylglutathione hydrolase